MTVIVAHTDGQRVTLGCDGQETSTHIKRYRTASKVWAFDPFTVMGIAGSAKIEQLFKWYLVQTIRKVTEGSEKLDNDHFMPVLISAMQIIMVNDGYDQSNMSDEAGGATLLVGRHGQIFYIRENYQISQYIDCFGAIGSGEEIALGALAMAKSTGFLAKDPRGAIKEAIKIASMISRDVGGQATIIETVPQPEEEEEIEPETLTA